MTTNREAEKERLSKIQADIETLASLLDKTMKQVDRLEERLNKLDGRSI